MMNIVDTVTFGKKGRKISKKNGPNASVKRVELERKYKVKNKVADTE
jgi:hypothetical protein